MTIKKTESPKKRFLAKEVRSMISINDPFPKMIEEGLSLLAPAVAAASIKKKNLVHFHVPAENTDVDFGAGKIPGIRMTTDNHVHLTAGTPLTTISLGLAAGDGISGPNGINILTQGHKTEYVNMLTSETYNLAAEIKYNDKKVEEVTAAWEEKCHNTKTESVFGSWNISCNADQTESVTGHKKETYGSYEIEVTGPVKQTFHEHREETMLGDLLQHVVGKTVKFQLDDHANFLYGKKLDTYVGAQATLVVGAQSTNNAGVQATTNTGGTLTVNTGVMVTTNLGPNVTASHLNVSATGVNLSATAVDCTKVRWTLKEVEAMIIK